MEIAKIVMLVVNILLGVMVLLGFLWGIKRGLKKSALRLGTLLIFFIIASIVSPYVTKAILKIDMPFIEGGTSILNYLETTITAEPQIADLVAENPAVMELITNGIIMLGNVIVFVVLCLLGKMVSWIVFAIVAKYTIKDSKREEKKLKKLRKKNPNAVPAQAVSVNGSIPMDLNKKPEKKHKLLGGLIGIAQGFIIVFCFLLPISGITGLYKQLSAPSEPTEAVVSLLSVSQLEGPEISGEPGASTGGSSSSSTNLEDLPETFEQIFEMVPPEVTEIIDAYNGSIVAKMGSVGNFSGKCFDTLASFKAGGKKIVLSSELLNVKALYNDVQYFVNLDWNNIDYKTFKYDRMRGVVEKVFDFGVINAVVPQLLPYALDTFLIEGDVIDAGELTEAITKELNNLVDSLDEDKKFMDTLEKDLLSLIDVAQAFGESGIIDMAIEGEGDYREYLNAITATNEAKEMSYLNQAVSGFFNAPSIQDIFVAGVNIGVEALKNLFVNENATYEHIKKTSVNWDDVKAKSLEFVNTFVDGYKWYDGLTDTQKGYFSSFDEANLPEIVKIDFTTPTGYVGKVIDLIKDSPLLTMTKNKKIFATTMGYVKDYKDFEGKEFINLDALANPSLKFEDEFKKLGEIVKLIYDSQILSEVDFSVAKNTDFDGMIDILLVNTVPSDSTSPTYINALVEKLTSFIFVNPVVEVGIDKLNEKLVSEFGSDMPCVRKDATSVLADFSSIIEKIVALVGGYDINTLVQDFEPIKLLEMENLTSGFDNLGDIVDDLKNSDNFGDMMFAYFDKATANETVGKYINLNIDAIEKTEDYFKTKLTSIAGAFDTLLDAGIADLITAETPDIASLINKFDEDKLVFGTWKNVAGEKVVVNVEDTTNPVAWTYAVIRVIKNKDYVYITNESGVWKQNGTVITGPVKFANGKINLQLDGESAAKNYAYTIIRAKATYNSVAVHVDASSLNSQWYIGENLCTVDIGAKTVNGANQTTLAIASGRIKYAEAKGVELVADYDATTNKWMTGETEVAVDFLNYSVTSGTKVYAITSIVSGELTYGDPATTITKTAYTKEEISTVITPFVSDDLFAPAIVYLVNLVNDKIADALDVAEVNKPTALPKTTSLKGQNETIVNCFDEVFALAGPIFNGEDFSIEKLDFAKLGTLMTTLKENAYVVARENAIFGGTYTMLVNYLKTIDEYGDDITSVLASYVDPLAVDWVAIFDVVDTAMGIITGGEIGAEDIGVLVAAIGEDKELQDIIKIAIIGTVFPEVNLEDETVKDIINEVDLTDEKVQDVVIEAIDVLDAATSDGDVAAAATDVITAIGALDEEDKTNLIDMIYTVAGDTSLEIPEEDKEDVATQIDESALSDDAKAKLKELFGIPTT